MRAEVPTRAEREPPLCQWSWRELERIRQEIRDDLLQPCRIGVHPGDASIAAVSSILFARASTRARLDGRAESPRPDLLVVGPRRDVAVSETRDAEKILDAASLELYAAAQRVQGHESWLLVALS